jgi:hypothetical protein
MLWDYNRFPATFVWFFATWLRFKFVQHYRIPEDVMTTCLYGCCCHKCSLCQMGRHVYGYRRLFDGDGRLDASMDYHSGDGGEDDEETRVLSSLHTV